MNTTPTLPTLLLLSSAFLPFAAQGAITPLPVTGWNQDMIINNGYASYNLSITGTVDNGGGNIEGGTFAAADTYPVQPSGTQTAVAGLTNSLYTSATSSGATFQFQDFDANNSLLLTTGLSGTLTLVTPVKMTTLALFGTSGNGPTAATVTVKFSDATSSTYTIAGGAGITADWFTAGSSVALAIGNRESNHSEDSYATIYYEKNSSISIYESDIVLSTADQAKKVASVTIANTASKGCLAIMAISSDAAAAVTTPLAITSTSFDFTGNKVTLNFTSNAGTVYKATHSATLNGTDWTAVGGTVTASGTSSSLVVPFTPGAKDFFRVEVGP